MGVGFAIPMNMAKAIGNPLIKNGSVTRGYLGILIQDLTPDLAKTFGLKEQKGILVSQVTQDSPAERAGLKQGDVIVEFAGKHVEKSGAFRNNVSLMAPGTEEKITILRDGSQKTIEITIGKLPDSGLAANVPSHNINKLGLNVKTLTRELADQFGYQGETGVVVTQVHSSSIADLAGIRPGMLIQEVNRKRIDDTEDFKHAVEQTPGHGVILMLIKDGQYSRYLALKTE
jgi:serine protease Do